MHPAAHRAGPASSGSWSRCATRAGGRPLAAADGPLAALAAERGATPSQLALAWLLRRSPTMLPIPGTASVAHLEQNVAAAEITLSDAEFAALTAAGKAAGAPAGA